VDPVEMLMRFQEFLSTDARMTPMSSFSSSDFAA
jgi:hypothetical protein